MLHKDKLRTADIFSGAAVALFGTWIVSQAFQMPMKDSWGGVVNVWYVSPALLPLCIGISLIILGLILSGVGFVAVGVTEFTKTLHWISSREFSRFLTSDGSIRFCAVVYLFLTLVFLNLPRIDFFVSAILFLITLITMFYFSDDRLLRRLLAAYFLITTALFVYFIFEIYVPSTFFTAFGADALALCLLTGYCLLCWKCIRHDPSRLRKYRIAVTVSIISPFLIGLTFKYLLMVPLPTEGLVVAIVDYIWYLDFLYLDAAL